MKFEVGGTKSGINSDNFVRLKDKEKITGIFAGEPFVFKDHWVGTHSEMCTGAMCAHCANKQKPKFRFHINFITKVGEEYQAKIFAQGWTVYEALKNLHESDYNLESTIVTITRNGTDTNTTYSILPAKHHQVTNELQEKLKKVPLLELDPRQFKKEEESLSFEEPMDSGVPF